MAGPGVGRPAAHVAGRPVGQMLPRSPAEALEPQRPPELAVQDDEEDNDHPVLRMFDGFVNFVFILGCAALGAFYFIQMEFNRPGPLEISTVFVVPKGEGTTAIADRLTTEGIITDRRI
ncbi:MAG: hypothetical protein ACTSYK_02140, partial [Alphaproteobacteria bacterium]